MRAGDLRAPRVLARGLGFRYPGSAEFELRVDRFHVDGGERVVCIGPSGSGKSTLLHLLAGILRPQRGTIVVDGVDLATLGDAALRRFRLEHVGLVFQEFELLEHLTIAENVLLPHLLGLGARQAAERRLQELAVATGIAPLLRRKPRHVSQGERQRVAICRALVTEPAVVFADEPTGNLDPRTARQVLDLLLEQASRRGAAVVMVTHDHEVLDRFDRVVEVDALLGVGAAAAGAER